MFHRGWRLWDYIYIKEKPNSTRISVFSSVLRKLQENALFMMSQFHLLKFNQVTMLRFLFHGYSWVNKCYILIFVICFKNHFITGQNMTKIVIFFLLGIQATRYFNFLKKIIFWTLVRYFRKIVYVVYNLAHYTLISQFSIKWFEYDR